MIGEPVMKSKAVPLERITNNSSGKKDLGVHKGLTSLVEFSGKTVSHIFLLSIAQFYN